MSETTVDPRWCAAHGLTRVKREASRPSMSITDVTSGALEWWECPQCRVMSLGSTPLSASPFPPTPAVPERGRPITHVCLDGKERSWGADICGDCRAAVPERGEEETGALAMRLDGLLETAGSHETIPVRVSLLHELRAALAARPTPEGEDARRMQQERDAYKLLSEGQAGLLVAYRTQSLRTPEGALRKIERAQNQLAKLSTPTRSERDGALSPQPKEGA